MEIKKKIKSFIGWQKTALPLSPAFRKSNAKHGKYLLVEYRLGVRQFDRLNNSKKS